MASVIRVDDPATGDVLMGSAKLGMLALRRLAPTILGSKRSTQSVVEALRDAGHAAVAEGLEGELLIREPSEPARTGLPHRAAPVRRAAGRRRPRWRRWSGRCGPASARGRTDRSAHDPNRPALQPRKPVETVALLTETAANAQTVWIGYVDNNGGASERLVDPLRVQGGWLTAYDHVRDAVRTFAVHRITGVAPVEPARTE